MTEARPTPPPRAEGAASATSPYPGKASLGVGDKGSQRGDRGEGGACTRGGRRRQRVEVQKAPCGGMLGACCLGLIPALGVP